MVPSSLDGALPTFVPCRRRIQNVTARKIAERQTASRYLKGLVEIGVLTERAFGREKLFIHPRLMGLVIRDTNDWVPFP